jgi:hypothetical protein
VPWFHENALLQGEVATTTRPTTALVALLANSRALTIAAKRPLAA